MANKIDAKTTVTTSELAAVLGVTARYVRQRTEDGLLHKEARGTYLLCPSVQAYINSRTPGGKTDEELEKVEMVKQTADARMKAARASILQAEADELKGKMHRSEDVAAMTRQLVEFMRTSIMALPGRLAVDVAAAGSASEASEIIKRESYKILEELSGFEYSAEEYQELVRERRAWESGGDDDES